MDKKFEIAISFDTTGSMYSCLEEVRKQLREMVQDLKRDIPGIRIAIFAHGDYCDAGKTYVTKYIDFTSNADRLCSFVSEAGPTGGGDAPECYELVMREVQEKLSWSPDSQRSLVIVGDALPHEASENQNVRSIDWKTETKSLRDMNVKIYAIECYGSRYEFYQHIASQTFGYYMQLSDIKEVKKVLMSICYREAGLESGGMYKMTGPGEPAPGESSKSSHDTTTASSTPAKTSPSSFNINSFKEQTGGMCCLMCKIPKLPNEFPPEGLTDECTHYLGVCLRCITKYVKEQKKCPQCSTAVNPEDEQMIWFEAILNTMFLDYAQVLAETKLAGIPGSEAITVATMNGDTAWIPYKPDMTIAALKRHVRDELNIDESKQKLLYNEQALKNASSLSDYKIPANASIQLIVPLYCVPENLNHVVFDLSWEFPTVNPDFLDASCLTFNAENFIQLIDWNHSKNSYYLKDAVEHSAKNETRAGGKIGHQAIHVYLKKLPSTVTHLYFTLSSWRSPNLSAFSNPSLQFYEASDSSTNLCSTTIGHALDSQAVIMCYMVRVNSQWQIFECDVGSLVNGNAKRYNPIRQRISELIKSSKE